MDLKNYKIVTSGDKNYFKFLWRFENNVFKQFGEYPIIYDLGLTDSQKVKLKSKIFEVKIPEDYSGYTTSGFIKTTHKPFCIIDFFTRYNLNCIYLDADILFSNKVKSNNFLFENFDIAVTPRHPIEQYEKLFTNGLINAGVIFFNNNKNTINFINLWIEECKKENTSDQLALSNLLSKNKDDFFNKNQLYLKNLKVKLLDPKKYNDVSLTKGLILHYKNAGRFKNAFKRYCIEYFIIQNSVPIRTGYVFYIKMKRLLKKIV